MSLYKGSTIEKKVEVDELRIGEEYYIKNSWSTDVNKIVYLGPGIYNPDRDITVKFLTDRFSTPYYGNQQISPNGYTFYTIHTTAYTKFGQALAAGKRNKNKTLAKRKSKRSNKSMRKRH